MPQASSNHQSPSPNSAGGSRDFIADIDNNKHDEEWSWTIIGAMARIQTQYAIEQGLDRKLPRDYFTDADRLKFFWSGFSNSSATKHFMDILFRSIINWEIILLIFLMVFVQIFVFSHYEGSQVINYIIFLGSYFSIVCYSLYITIHYRYFVYGDLSARMMFALMLGRLLFLCLSATVLSVALNSTANYLESNPKELYGWTSGIYFIINLFCNAKYYFGSKEDFYLVFYNQVLPEIKETSNEMLIVFFIFGVAPFILMYLSKSITLSRIKNEQEKFNKGE